MLSKNGGVRSEFTVYREGPEKFYLVGAGALERHDWDYLWNSLPKDGSVYLQKVTTQYGVLVIAGPRSRELLQKLTDTDLSKKNFPWLKFINVGVAQARALRVNFVGELGWELHHPIEMQNTIFDLVMDAGAPLGIKPFGIRAMDSMRIEKSYRLIPVSCRSRMRRSKVGWIVSFDSRRARSSDAIRSWTGRDEGSRMPS
jgi:dimethylglycine dehydrogenase